MAVDCEPCVEEWYVEESFGFLDGLEWVGEVVKMKCELGAL